jgi:CRISPR type III-A-associated RAMP protein Csm4
MNPGLVVKLRPAGPWRIGPDSGARNRVDFIYHSDTLYSAVTSAMAKLGSLDEWLTATARAASPEVCFSSCFPFVDEIGFVVPPRTIWPPSAPSMMAARTRWKSARFVPLGIVQSILAGRKLKEHHWTVDGVSQCLLPTGKHGPFRTDTRWSAAIDRLSGSTERHSTTCIEFRPGAGLWAIASFRDEAAHEKWIGPVKAAFRLLADTGFGGERSRGWGRSEAPEFIDGQLPEMILPPTLEPEPVVETVPEPQVQTPAVETAPEPAVEATPEPAAEESAAEDGTSESEMLAESVQDAGEPAETTEIASVEGATSELEPVAEIPQAAPVESEPVAEASLETVEPEPVAAEASVEATPDIAPLVVEQTSAPEAPQPEEVEPAPAVPVDDHHHHWLLSLFSPGASDVVDWTRGSYTTVTRGGRVESPAGSGELKKLVQMVTEGSVLYGESAPTGAAPDVAPDGFAHPVFRAGFAVAIPLRGARS